MITQIRVKLTAILALFLMLSPAVSAQSTTIVPNTITVVGEGTASAPANSAEVVITIGTDGNVYIDPATIETNAISIPEAIDVSSILDAIIAYGVPVNDVQVLDPMFGGEWGSGMTAQPVTILVHVLNPTVGNLAELLDVVRTSAHADGLYLNQFGVVYGVDDCRTLRQQARVDAVANARSEAEDQAAALDTTLGNAIASRDTYPMNMGYATTNGCTGTEDVKYTALQFDPSLPAEVEIMIAIEVSFEIP